MSLQNNFFHFFPPPKYLLQPAVGLDISDRSAKFLEFKFKRSGLILNRFSNLDIPAGIIEDGRIKDKEELISILQSWREKFNLKNTIVSLPEEQAFVFKIKAPALATGHLTENIEYRLEEHIPLPPTEVIFDYEIISRPKNSTGYYLLSVAAFPKKMVNDYYEVLVESGWNPVAFEIEAQSLARAFLPPDSSKTIMLIDIGGHRTGFALLKKGEVVFTSTAPNIGGRIIEKTIAKNLNISLAEAERRKIKKGLIRSQDNEDLFYSIIPFASSLKDEIRRIDIYWNKKNMNKGKIEEVILCGGQATLKGLEEYLSSTLGITVKVGDPWRNISFHKDILPNINSKEVLRYGTATGLALRGGHFPNCFFK